MTITQCPLPRPAPQDLWDRTADQFSVNVLGGGKIIPESNEWYAVGNQFLATELYYSLAEQWFRETDPRQACCDNLIKMAADEGVYPYPATFATGFVTITGISGSTLPANMQFQFGTRTYRADVTSQLPPVIPPSGSVMVRIVAVEPGAVGNELASTGTIGSLVSELPGVNSTVTSCGGQFCNGRDAETCDDFRTRYLDRIAYKPIDDLAWAYEKLREFPCLTRICLRNCGCCEQMHELQLYAFFDGTFPHGIPPLNVLNDLQLWFFGTPQGVGAGKAPFGVRGSFYQPTAAAIDITIGGLDCVSSTQIELIRTRVAALFSNLCPGTTTRPKMFELTVAQVIGPDIDVVIDLAIAEGAVGLTLTDCGDIIADCDTLPVVGTILTPSSGSC